MARKIIYVEGNTGVGKSTFLHMMHESFGYRVAYEPVHLWQNINNTNMLQSSIQDPVRWSYTLQSYIAVTNVRQLIEMDYDQPVLVERSLYSGLQCFAQVALQQGFMNGAELAIYVQFFNLLYLLVEIRPAGIIYLRSTPEICMQRIEHRGRNAEHTMNISYIQALHQRYEQWLIEHNPVAGVPSDIKVLVLDATRDIVHDFQVDADQIKKIEKVFEEWLDLKNK